MGYIDNQDKAWVVLKEDASGVLVPEALEGDGSAKVFATSVAADAHLQSASSAPDDKLYAYQMVERINNVITNI